MKLFAQRLVWLLLFVLAGCDSSGSSEAEPADDAGGTPLINQFQNVIGVPVTPGALTGVFYHHAASTATVTWSPTDATDFVQYELRFANGPVGDMSPLLAVVSDPLATGLEIVFNAAPTTYTNFGLFVVTDHGRVAGGQKTYEGLHAVTAVLELPAWYKNVTAPATYLYDVARDGAGNRWVLDEGKQVVLEYDRMGSFVTWYTDASWTDVLNIERAPGDQLWLADSGSDTVWQYNAADFSVAGWVTGPNSPGDIAIAGDGSFLSPSYLGGTVEMFAAGSSTGISYGTPGTGPGEYSYPVAVSYSPDGTTFYVLDTGNRRVQVISVAGAYLGEFGSDPLDGELGCFDNCWDLGVAPSGRIFVSDWNKGMHVYDADHTFVDFIPAAFLDDSLGLAGFDFEPTGGFSIVDSARSRVIVTGP